MEYPGNIKIVPERKFCVWAARMRSKAHNVSHMQCARARRDANAYILKPECTIVHEASFKFGRILQQRSRWVSFRSNTK
jgi:alpha-beta hydrolase superfamily lysophospholipase